MNVIQAAKELIRRRKYAYSILLRTPEGQEIIQDLARFCRATTTTFHRDPHIQAHLEGRREVFLRIQNQLHLTDEQLYKLAQLPEE